MPQKIPPEPDKKGVVSSSSSSSQRTEPVVGSINNMSDVERFNRFLAMDFRLPSSYFHLDLETQKVLNQYREKFIRWGNALSVSRRYINSKQKQFYLPPRAALLVSLPLFAFYCTHHGSRAALGYQLPGAMPGLSAVLQKPSRIDWSSVVGTQYFHQIDWKDVGISNFRHDSVFVLFSPKTRFQKQNHYVAYFETPQEVEDVGLERIKISSFPETPRSIKNKRLRVLKQTNLIKRIARIAQPHHMLLSKLQRGSGTKTIPTFELSNSAPTVSLRQKLKNIPTNELNYSLKRTNSNTLTISRKNNGSLKLTPTHVLKQLKTVLVGTTGRQHLTLSNEKAFRLRDSQGTRQLHQFKTNTFSWNNKKYASVGHLLSSRDHHVLYSPEDIQQIHQKLHAQLSLHKKIITRDMIASSHYWQTYFNSLDLIPMKMESMTFPNKPVLLPDQQFKLDIEERAKKLRDTNRADILPTLQDRREKWLKKSKENEFYNLTSPAKALLPNAGFDKLEPVTDHLIGTNTNTVRYQRKYLVGENQFSLLNKQQDNKPFSLDYAISEENKNYLDRQKEEENWKNTMKNKYANIKENWGTETYSPIAPLFRVVDDMPLTGIPFKKTIQYDPTSLIKKDPVSKITLLTEAINENLKNAFVSKAMVRQSTRYLINNSLFNFKLLVKQHLHGRSKTLEQWDDLEESPFVSNYCLHESKPLNDTFELESLDKTLFYRQLLKDSQSFHPEHTYSFEAVPNMLDGPKQQTIGPSKNVGLDFLLDTLFPNTALHFKNQKQGLKTDLFQPLGEQTEQNCFEQVNKNVGAESNSKNEKAKRDKNKEKRNWTKLKKYETINFLRTLERNPRESKRKFNNRVTILYRRHLDLIEDLYQDVSQLLPEAQKQGPFLKTDLFQPLGSSESNPRGYKLTRNFKRSLALIDDLYKMHLTAEKTNEVVLMEQKLTDIKTEQKQLWIDKNQFHEENEIEMERQRTLPEPISLEQQQKNEILWQKTMDQFEERKVKLEAQETKIFNTLKKTFINKLTDLHDRVFADDLFSFSPVAVQHEDREQSWVLLRKEIEKRFSQGYAFEVKTLDLKQNKNVMLDDILESPDVFLENVKMENNDNSTIITPSQHRFEIYNKYQRYLLTNPFRILPKTQLAFFSNASRDFVEEDAYQQYVDWYQQFFLENLNFIKPCFDLDNLLKPSQMKAYDNYQAKESGFKDQLLTKPAADFNVGPKINWLNLEHLLNKQKAEALFDEEQTEELYDKQADEDFSKQDDDSSTIRSALAVDSIENEFLLVGTEAQNIEQGPLPDAPLGKKGDKKERLRDVEKRLKKESKILAVKAVEKQAQAKAKEKSDYETMINRFNFSTIENKEELFRGFKLGLTNKYEEKEKEPKFDDTMMDDFDFSRIDNNTTLEELFEDQLAYYLSPVPEQLSLGSGPFSDSPQEVQKKNAVFQLFKNIWTKLRPQKAMSETDLTKDEDKLDVSLETGLTEEEEKALAHNEVLKAFNWGPKLPFMKPQSFTQSDLNKEIAKQFHRSQSALFKSKNQIKAESKTKQAIRNRIIQGHSPYLQRQLSGYLNPDASFKDKYAELLSWDNVFYKARELYQHHSVQANLFTTVRNSLFNRKLSTINSPFFELTSAFPQYHYECFGRLVNSQNGLFDFKQLNYHTVAKAKQSSQSPVREIFAGESPIISASDTRIPGFASKYVFVYPKVAATEIVTNKKTQDTKGVVSGFDNDPYSFEKEIEYRNGEYKLELYDKKTQKWRPPNKEEYKKNQYVSPMRAIPDGLDEEVKVKTRKIKKRPEELEQLKATSKQRLFHEQELFSNIERKYRNAYDNLGSHVTNGKGVPFISKEQESKDRLRSLKRATHLHPKMYPQRFGVGKEKERLKLLNEERVEKQIENAAAFRQKTYDDLVESSVSPVLTDDEFFFTRGELWAHYTDKQINNIYQKRLLRPRKIKQKKDKLFEEQPFSYYQPTAAERQALRRAKSAERKAEKEVRKEKKREAKELAESETGTIKPKIKEGLRYMPSLDINSLLKKPLYRKLFYQSELEEDPDAVTTSTRFKISKFRKEENEELTKYYRPSINPMRGTDWQRYYKHLGLPKQKLSGPSTYDGNNHQSAKYHARVNEELMDADTLMAKVFRNRRDVLPSAVSGYIDHSLFDIGTSPSKWIYYNKPPSLEPSTRTEKFMERLAHDNLIHPSRYALLNFSPLDPMFWSYVLLIVYVCQSIGRIRRDYEETIAIGIVNFLTKLDLTTIKSIVRVNEAVVRCKGIGFEKIVGGDKLLHLFYPLILLNRNKHFSFGTLPVFEYSLLQKLASTSPGFVKHGDRFEFTVLQPTEKEKQMSLQLKAARNNMIQVEQQSCLLIGPPGTGKTYLVKALASESFIPVVIPSRYNVKLRMSNVETSIQNPDELYRMEQFFSLAKAQKPCILFLDEIDSMGQNRHNVITDTSGTFIGQSLLSQPSELVRNKAFGSWATTASLSFEALNFDRRARDYQKVVNPVISLQKFDEEEEERRRLGAEPRDLSKFHQPEEQKKVSANVVAKLTKLLSLVDSVNPRHVLLIAATNRPYALDPALTRPGRLNKVLYLDLPSKQKRFDLLKFYSRSRVSEDINWEYFAKQTSGLSPAHLKTAINLSALRTAYEMIEKQQNDFGPSKSKGHKKISHSEASIEYGIQNLKNDGAFMQAFIKRSTRNLTKLATPLFFAEIGQMHLWQHVSLGSPIRPIVLPQCNLSQITRKESLPTKTETQVWNGMPNYIVRVGFPTFYHNVKTLIFKSIRGSGVTTVEYRPKDIGLEKRQELRERFYQRHRKSWLKAYLLSDPEKINYSLLENVTIKDHPLANGLSENELLDEASAEDLQLFKDFVDRNFPVHMFGTKLLLHSSYASDNPLMFNTEYIYKKVANTIIRSSGQFTRFSSTTPIYLALLQDTPALYKQSNQIEAEFSQMFSNPLALHRSIAYNANKALMVYFLTETFEQEHMYDIWNRFKYDWNPEAYKKVFLKTVKENFVTRKQFENYLLALSGGKIGEHLMLFYREALPKWDPSKPRTGRYTYDVSEIGREELHQMTWLLNIMIEKNLFYSPDIDLSKQALTAEETARKAHHGNTSVVSIAANKERWHEYDRNIHRMSHKFDGSRFLKHLVALMLPPKSTYWWEPQGLELPSPGIQSSIKEWGTLFDKRIPFRIQRWPVDLNYDTYRPNILRTGSLLESPFDAKYLPTSFVKLVTKQEGTWNQTCYSHTERLSRALLLDTFAKSFYVLAGHRELCDYLSYYLLRYGKVQANKLKQLSESFLRVRLEQIKKDQEIKDQIEQIQKKKPE